MGFHSDQSLDLDKNSYICVYSCYNNAETKNLRKLRIKKKQPSNECNARNNECNNHFDIILEHNSIVMFSVDTNSKYLHSIILENDLSHLPHLSQSTQLESDNLWLGITFRQSKTFIFFNNELPYFPSNNQELILANDKQKKEFYKYRSLENSNIEYIYPEINYTISIGDILPIK
jgi:hypothetical protein